MGRIASHRSAKEPGPGGVTRSECGKEDGKEGDDHGTCIADGDRDATRNRGE